MLFPGMCFLEPVRIMLLEIIPNGCSVGQRIFVAQHFPLGVPLGVPCPCMIYGCFLGLFRNQSNTTSVSEVSWTSVVSGFWVPCWDIGLLVPISDICALRVGELLYDGSRARHLPSLLTQYRATTKDQRAVDTTFRTSCIREADKEQAGCMKQTRNRQVALDTRAIGTLTSGRHSKRFFVDECRLCAECGNCVVLESGTSSRLTVTGAKYTAADRYHSRHGGTALSHIHMLSPCQER